MLDIVSRTFSGGKTYPSSCNARAKPIELKVNVAQTWLAKNCVTGGQQSPAARGVCLQSAFYKLHP